MSDYTVDDSMAKILYELSDREIYNDVRAELGVSHSETVVDADADYNWRAWKYYYSIGGGMGFCKGSTYRADANNAISWKLTVLDAYWNERVEVSPWYIEHTYYDYTCVIEESDASH